MRNRHLPRLCDSCQAPMAGQEATCWRCGTDWAADDETWMAADHAPRAALRLIRGGAVTDGAEVPQLGVDALAASIAVALPEARAVALGRIDGDGGR